ncbi:MAG: translation initiation factor IF-2, partial [Patescibacteria group bacterium]
IDFETASIIGSDLGVDVKLEEGREEIEESKSERLEKILGKEDKDKLKIRPPVIVIMGHVDHGKTKLLDAIRKTNVVEGEAGGITQHIGAYQVERNNRLITFIDTPGHEAFTAMRSRGTKVADIAILVVAADDGVKPQTIEAFRIIEAAKVPFLVAINKIDKKEADIDKTKQELSTQLNITPEDWGGKTICAPISAKDGKGVEDLLDMVLLTADEGADKIKSNPEASALGTVIESHIDKGTGPVATILIQNGTLRIGDPLCFSGKLYGKVRALKNYKYEEINKAGPSNPAIVIGLKILPVVGDMLEVGKGERVKKNKMQEKKSSQFIKQVEEKKEDDKTKKINLIIKSDVLGSAEAIEESLEKINTKKVKVKIVHKGLGNITEGDIDKAEGSQAQVIGFNVKISPQVENLIRAKGIIVKLFNVIYDLIEYIEKEMQGMIETEFKRVDLGKLKVMGIFRTENKSQIIGGKVIEGKIKADSLIEVIRDKQVIEEGKLIKLQSGKQDVSVVEENQECGIQYEGRPIIEKGDILLFHKKEIVV